MKIYLTWLEQNFSTDDVISSLFIHVNWCSSTSFVALWRSLSPDSNTFGMNRNTVCESDLISVRPPCLSGIWSQTHPAERLKPEEWRLIGQRFDKHCLRMTITYGMMFGCLCGSYSLMEQHFTIGVLLVWCRSTMKSQGGSLYLFKSILWKPWIFTFMADSFRDIQLYQSVGAT